MLKVAKGQIVIDQIRQAEPSFHAPCGGHHQCGKCKIKVMDGSLPIHREERVLLSEKELDSGVRLACVQTEASEDCTILSMQESGQFCITGSEQVQFTSKQEKGYAIAIDIGTTTIVMEVLDLFRGIILQERTFLNPQNIYGGDVITRIDYVNKHGIHKVQQVLLSSIEEHIQDYVTYDIRRMVVCGNPAMTHIFMGEDPSSIASAPYTCKVKNYREVPVQRLFPNIVQEFIIQILPPISAYVGSDIVMDIYASEQYKKEENSVLIDLGTNGEISLYHDHHFSVSSAACGPAFEGGNMSCGIGALPGAICDVEYDGAWILRTIDHKKAIGICGSGYMSLLNRAHKQGFLDESGFLNETISLANHACLTQQDVREFQLAKSAIASAFVCLCLEEKVHFEDIQTLYIAGGFGKHVHITDIIDLGILPEVCLPHIQVIGNSAIQGTCQFAIKQDLAVLVDIIKSAKSLLLANNPNFTDQFMKNMMFEVLHET